MANITEKIERRITVLEGKIDTHSIDKCGAKFEMTGVHTVIPVMEKAA